VAKRSRVWLCRKCKYADCLEAFLDGSRGVKVRGRMEWFARIDKAKPMVALLRVADPERSGKIGPALESHRVARRSGISPR
jgi:hypothetical protein